MAIKGLTDREAPRFPRIGFLRKGGPKRTNSNGKEIMGIDLDHFRFDSDDAEAVADFEEAYGKEPKQVNVFFPWPEAGQNFQAWKEAYTAGALQHRCDGETCVLWLDSTSGEYRTDPKPCPGGCEEIGYLSVIIPELGRFAFVTALTHSIHDIMELQSNLEAYELLGGQLRGVPFVLRRIERKISTPGQNGKRVRRAKWLMHLETKPEWSRMKLAGLELDALPAHVRAALPAPTEAQLVIEAYKDEQRAEEAAGMTYEQHAERLQANVNRMRGPEWDAFDEAAEGDYRVETLRAETPEPPTSGTTTDAEFEALPSASDALAGDEIWRTWRSRGDAVAWAMAQTAPDGKPLLNGYEPAFLKSWSNLQAELKVSTADMYEPWHRKIRDKLAGNGDAQPTHAELDAIAAAS